MRICCGKSIFRCEMKIQPTLDQMLYWNDRIIFFSSFLTYRVIGLCLEQNEICPLSLNRHVLKYILSRPVRNWKSFIDFNPGLIFRNWNFLEFLGWLNLCEITKFRILLLFHSSNIEGERLIPFSFQNEWIHPADSAITTIQVILLLCFPVVCPLTLTVAEFPLTAIFTTSVVLLCPKLWFFFSLQISWHDLAFYDPTLYESLRQLIEDSKRPDSSEFFSSLDLTFYIQLPTEEG